MKLLRYLAFSGLVLFCLLLVFSAHYYCKGFFKKSNDHHRASSARLNPVEKIRIVQQAALTKQFLAGKSFNKKYCFLVDMQLPSGRNRFFVYDLVKDSVVMAGLVAHGSCGNSFRINPKFSNTCQSCCTALGKYRVGGKYQGQFGTAYKLYGLDSSNSNTYKRNIVLHAYSCVPENETDPYPVCNSSGCPMVAPGFLKQLQSLIDKNPQPVILWIFN